VLNIITIKKCGSAMDEELNPKMKVRSLSCYLYNL
jgi:hypothetical protein